jgi:hypothetical protein
MVPWWVRSGAVTWSPDGIAQKPDGSSATRTPAAFEQTYGFRNDPTAVRLTE